MFGIFPNIARNVLSCKPRFSLYKQSPTARPLSNQAKSELTAAEYEKLSNETLDNLADVFDRLGDECDVDNSYDVQHAYGVLKVDFGPNIGVYIINRQAPNKQLWLSSPFSGPKRYDYNALTREWVYKHDGSTLHRLLEKEISGIVRVNVAFPKS